MYVLKIYHLWQAHRTIWDGGIMRVKGLLNVRLLYIPEFLGWILNCAGQWSICVRSKGTSSNLDQGKDLLLIASATTYSTFQDQASWEHAEVSTEYRYPSCARVIVTLTRILGFSALSLAEESLWQLVGVIFQLSSTVELIDLPGERHRLQKKMLNPFFSIARMRKMSAWFPNALPSELLADNEQSSCVLRSCPPGTCGSRFLIL